jgi:hypothetical protein
MCISGIIKNWQIHTLSISKDKLNELMPGDDFEPLILTGTVEKDFKGRWEKGYHMRSSIVKHFDKKNKIVQTKNSLYKLKGKQGDNIIFDPADPDKKDLGDFVLSIYY